VARPHAAVLVSTDWAAVLAPAGLVPTELVGSGMEGTVLRVADDRVVKVWHTAGEVDLLLRQEFYDAVADALPVPTTRVLDVVRVGDRWASVEPWLAGRPVDGPVTDAAAHALAEVLAALAAVPPAPAMTALPVLPGEPPLDVVDGFEGALAGLVERRAGAVLAAAVPGLADLVAATAAALRGLPPARPGLVHGDLVAGNVLVDEDGRPAAVLDFGFLTTVGDPAFDAAVTASIVDMYSPAHAATESRLDRVLGAGHDPVRRGVHRAAYAVVTATCFSPTGDDGHFAWCAAVLRRADVRAAVRAAT
jgi:aminoglycoside phosphotransferase (APT) family kinase protein